jgi:RNA polymerase sigma factor (sigma-70 family)
MSPSLEQRLIDTSFERLYRRHRRDVYGAVLRDVRDPEEAEDVTQIAFLNAFRAMRRGEEPKKPRAWLVTIARNVIRRRYRTMAARPQEVALDPETAVDLTEVGGPTAGEIAAAIRRLPPNQRAVILLREIQGRSYAEISRELGLSPSAVETLIFRARRSLSEALEIAEHAPVTQRRRARALSFLPLPGLGKLGSLGFSVGRVAVAALAGGVVIAVAPVVDGGAEPLRPVTLERPAIADVQAPAAKSRPAPEKTTTHAKGTRKRPVNDRPVTASEPSDAGAGPVAGLPAVGLPPVEAPDPAALPLPSLPVDPSPLPVDPPPLPVDPPPLTVDPPPLTVDPSLLPVDPPSLPPPPSLG